MKEFMGNQKASQFEESEQIYISLKNYTYLGLPDGPVVRTPVLPMQGGGLTLV